MDVPDSQLAPNVVAGGRVMYVESPGTPAVGASVVAVSMEQWYVLGSFTGTISCFSLDLVHTPCYGRPSLLC